MREVKQLALKVLPNSKTCKPKGHLFSSLSPSFLPSLLPSRLKRCVSTSCVAEIIDLQTNILNGGCYILINAAPQKGTESQVSLKELLQTANQQITCFPYATRGAGNLKRDKKAELMTKGIGVKINIYTD